MLWIILLSVLLLVGIGCIIGAQFMDYWSDAHDCVCIVGWVLMVICVAIILVLSIAIYQANVPGSMFNQETRIDLDNTIEELNSTFTTLSMNEGPINEPLTISSVNEYNKQVKEFRTKIQSGQYRRNNLWTNWFTSNIWTEYTGEEVQFFPAN